uniref:Uncharacterized protein n=1 Tax=Anguilla anguilla TaxID=7936 RepID=A0A0E9XGS7_ANGAN
MACKSTLINTSLSTSFLVVHNWNITNVQTQRFHFVVLHCTVSNVEHIVLHLSYYSAGPKEFKRSAVCTAIAFMWDKDTYTKH